MELVIWIVLPSSMGILRWDSISKRLVECDIIPSIEFPLAYPDFNVSTK